VDPLIHEPHLQARAAAFTSENVALIKTVPQKFFGEIEARVAAGVRAGDRASDIAQDIQDRFGVAETNATRIANDQIGKFIGELNKVRQEGLGITHYTWRGVLDNRERADHEDREGERFAWDDAPEDGHPGEPINCRCFAEPDLDAILEDLG
jgi:SPP1 gp7 family putative phage head morphogenesis protein